MNGPYVDVFIWMITHIYCNVCVEISLDVFSMVKWLALSLMLHSSLNYCKGLM